MTQRPNVPKIFKPEDFDKLSEGTRDWAAAHANWLFKNWLAEQRLVYHSIGKKSYWSEANYDADTHVAYLVAPTELKPQVCEHEPKPYIKDLIENECKHCGVKLKAKWEVE